MIEGCKGCCAALILVPLLCCALVACSVVWVTTQGPDAPISDSFEPSRAEALAFDAELRRATAQASMQRWFVLSFNERQISSWMALEGEDFAQEYGHVFPFESVQVGLDDGEITFYGELKRGMIALPLEVVLVPQFDRNGQMDLGIRSANFGGITVPDMALETVEAQFEDVLIRPFNDLQSDVFFYSESLNLNDGSFVIQGALR